VQANRLTSVRAPIGNAKRRLVRAVLPIMRKSRLHPRCTRAIYCAATRITGSTTRIFRFGNFSLQLDPRQFVDAKILLTGQYEPETCATIRSLIRSGDTAIDVGANIGILTGVMASAVGSTGNVAAVEASAWAFSRLCENILLNKWSHVIPVRVLAGNTTESMKKVVLPNGYTVVGRVTATEQTVDMTTVDLLCAAMAKSRLDLLKIDTDGFESQVLGGAQNSIIRFKPAIIFEFGPSDIRASGGCPEQLLASLCGHGYMLARVGATRPSDPAEIGSAAKNGDTMNLVAVHRAEHRQALFGVAATRNVPQHA
jgi:FkbM family methyltransferase